MLIYGIHPNEKPADLAGFLQQTGITFKVKSDVGSTLSKFAFPNGVNQPYPREVIIDKKLQIRAIRNSYSPKAVDALVQKLLAEK